MQPVSNSENFFKDDYYLDALLRVGDVVLINGRHHAQHSLIFEKHDGTIWVLTKFGFIDTTLLDKYADIVGNSETSFVQKQIKIKEYERELSERKKAGTFVKLTINCLEIKCVKYDTNSYIYKNFLIESAKPSELTYIAPKRFTSFAEFDLNSFSYFNEHNETYEELTLRVGELLTRGCCLIPELLLTLFPTLENCEPSNELLNQYLQ